MKLQDNYLSRKNPLNSDIFSYYENIAFTRFVLLYDKKSN